MHKFTNEVIAERKQYHENLENEALETDDVGIKKRFAFLDLLIKESKGGTVLSDADIREEVDTFMFEGMLYVIILNSKVCFFKNSF